MFSAELKVEADNRAMKRLALSVPGRVEGDERPRCVCRVTDLSRGGARLLLFSMLESGATVEITLPGAVKRIARIAWVRDFEAGCAFEAPLEDDFVEELARVYYFTRSRDAQPLPPVRH